MLRGEIYRAALDPVLGSEQGGTRPVVVVQNNVGNRYSPTVIVLAVTSRMNKARLPTHIEVPSPIGGLPRDSVILAEQVRTLDKQRLTERLGALPESVMAQVDRALEEPGHRRAHGLLTQRRARFEKMELESV